MTFTYTGDPSSSKSDAIRYLIGDTDESEVLVSDEEIQWNLDQWPDKSVYTVASKVARNISNRMAREVSISSDGQTLALSELQQKFDELASSLESQGDSLEGEGAEVYVGGISLYEPPKWGIRPLSFGTHMHDNIEAGNQDYGDQNHIYDWRWDGYQL